MPKKVFCAFGVHIDAVAGWLGTYGGEDSIGDLSCGLFAGEIGTQRILDLFKKHNLKSTWFIPGHSIETFPEQCKEVVKAGHEIGLHGYSHEVRYPRDEKSATDSYSSSGSDKMLRRAAESGDGQVLQLD